MAVNKDYDVTITIATEKGNVASYDRFRDFMIEEGTGTERYKGPEIKLNPKSVLEGKFEINIHMAGERTLEDKERFVDTVSRLMRAIYIP